MTMIRGTNCKRGDAANAKQPALVSLNVAGCQLRIHQMVYLEYQHAGQLGWPPLYVLLCHLRMILTAARNRQLILEYRKRSVRRTCGAGCP